MGAVYEVVDRHDDERHVALKLLAPPRRQAGLAALHFRREYQTLVRLRHPRVVEAYDFGVDGDRMFYTLELLQGPTPQARHIVPLAQTASIIRDIASALAMLHARRLLHRDLSTRNIGLGSDGHAKLIDFGLLSGMGPPLEIGGTPPYIAPETLFGLPLDQRADLFGLGAVLYVMLTGHHAYPAKRVADRVASIEKGTTPPPPSHHDERIPPELDALVMSLLSNDRQARPATAADVIDRISAIVDLPAAPELEMARGYVQSAVLVGRQRELDVLRRAVLSTAAGRGCALLLRGRSGAGKSRLLREISIDARVHSLVGVHVTADAHGRGPFEVLRRLADALSSALPQLVQETVLPRAAKLAGALPELVPTFKRGRRQLASDPREQRLQLQLDICDWIVELARKQPLAIMLDDIQRCDESTAAVLLALAERLTEHPLMLVATSRTDDDTRVPAAVQALERVAETLTIGGLSADDLEALVRGSFGDVPNAARLAAFLHEHTGGSPLLVTDLLHSLVDRRLIVYSDGMWTIASDVASTELPRTLAASFDLRVATLDPDARRLAEILALVGSAAPLDLVVALATHLDEAQVFETLDRLVEAEILIGDRDAYRFRHASIREAVRRGIDPAGLAGLHATIGDVLFKTALPGERDAEIGWHFVHGGRSQQGAPLLERAGRELFDRTAFGEAIGPLTTSLDVYRAQGVVRHRWPELHYLIAMAGFFSDREVANRWVGPTLELLAEYAGLDRIRRAQKVVGARMGFVAGISRQAISQRATPSERRVMSPRVAIRMLARTAILAAGLALAQAERERLQALVTLMEPLSRVRVGNLDRVGRFITMLTGISFGRFGTARRLGEELLADEVARRATSEASNQELRLFHGAVRFVYGLALNHTGSDRALDNIEALEGLDLRLWRLTAQQLRKNYHLRRGEADMAGELSARLELDYARLGSVWQLELASAPGTAMARALIDDVMGLRRSMEQLQRIVATGVDYTGALELARSDYYRIRGDFDLALASAERGLQFFPPEGGFGVGWGLVARMHCLLEGGRITEAIQAREIAEVHFNDPSLRDDGLYFRFGRVCALLEATVGKLSIATERIDTLIAEATALENPAYLGLLHETRAEISRELGDRQAQDHHARTAEAWLRSTDNPVLIGRVHALESLMRESVVSVSGERTEVDSDAPTVQHASAPAAPVQTSVIGAVAETALARLVSATGAASGFMFVVFGNGLVHVAPGGEPPPATPIFEMATRAIERGLGWQQTYRGPEGSYRATVLRVDPELGTAPVAVAALRRADRPMRPPDTIVVSEIAASLESTE